MKYLCTIILLFISFHAISQSIHVEDFGRYKKPFLKKATFVTDKRNALIDFYTSEKGFSFFIGNMQVAAEEGEGYLTVTLPHKSDFLIIKHPKYGIEVWKIPGSGVKKKKRYHANLVIDDVDKEYKQEKQWLLLKTKPENAIVYVDSMVYQIQKGYLQLYLPIGKHPLLIESPFYTSLSDTVELADTARVERVYTLKPFYSYLTVETGRADANIMLDGKLLGKGHVSTGRLKPGRYNLSVNLEDSLYYSVSVEIENAERKVVDLSDVEYRTLPSRSFQAENRYIMLPDSVSLTEYNEEGIHLSEVYIEAFDNKTEIWLNREYVGKGEWKGKLAPGFYAVSTKKEGLDSRTEYFWVDGDKNVELKLMSPVADYGFLNVSCDEENAEIYLNGVHVGYAPCVLRDLPINRTYRVRLVKGKKEAEQIVDLKGNDIVNLNLKLK